MRGSRARLTIPDVAYLLMSLAILGALYPVWQSGFVANIDEVSTAAAWLWRLMLPLALLVLFSMIFLKATAGVSR